MTISDFDSKFDSLAPTFYSTANKKQYSTEGKAVSTQTTGVTTDFMFKTYDELRFYDSKLTTPFPELLNSSGGLKRMDTSVTNTVSSKLYDQSNTNSGLVTVDRKMSSKERPASVIQKKTQFDFTRKSSSNDSINPFEGRYTPIGKLEILCEDNKDRKKAMKKLKAITEANLKAKSSSVSSNNRRSKKSAGRIERSKQILSKSCERKSSKKKNMESKKNRNKVIQIVQNQ